MPDVKTILIVEDDTDFARTLEVVLKLRKHDVDVANNGLEALNAARRKNFDICFLDIKMPFMGGLECVQELRKILPKATEYIIMTGFRDEETLEAAKQVGAKHILLKPFAMSKFVEYAEARCA